ncbi:MAG TPA: hypothetical protein VMW62_13950 [Chloroflexota bacterium]|nr:hypothetical protein [Chloroflexota bacterium]
MAENVKTEFQVMVLQLDQVEPDPRNIRLELPKSTEVETLREALRAALKRSEEFDEAITVYPIRKGVYRIKSGHRRYVAAQGVVDQLHFHIVKPPDSETERILGQLDDNLNHETLSDIEIGRSLLALQQASGCSLGQLADMVRGRGIQMRSSKTWVAQKLELVKKVHEDVQRLVHTGLLPSSIAFEIRHLPRREQPEVARRIVQEGLTVTQVRAMLGTGGNEGEGEADTSARLESALGPGGFDVHRPELAQAQIRDALAMAANAASTAIMPRPSTPVDPQRRSSPVQLRYELQPSRMTVAPRDPVQKEELAAVGQDDWGRTRSDLHKAIARDAICVGQRNRAEAQKLADDFMDQVGSSSLATQMAVVGVRDMLEGPALMCPPAVASFLRMWMREVDRRLAEHELVA